MGSILQVLPAFHAGGVEQTTLLVANALAEQGFGSFIASAGGLMTKKLHPNVMHIYLPLNTKNPYLMFSNAKKLKTIIAMKVGMLKNGIVHVTSFIIIEIMIHW